MPLLQLDHLLTEAGEFLITEDGLFGVALENAHHGYEILDFWPNWEVKPIETTERSGTILDNITGLPVVKPRADQPRQAMEFAYRLTSRDDIARFRRFIVARRGLQGAFWIPTWEADIKPVQNISGSDIFVESIGYEATLLPFLARRYMVLIRSNRTLVPFVVNAAADNGITETFNTDTAFGGAPGFDFNHVMISFLLLVRLDADVDYTYLSPTHMTARIRVVELPLEVPDPLLS
jgi:hypothetical protein